jgi:glycosyltransferase involved in cell wall biosynthesis
MGDVFVLPAANRPPTGLAVAVLDAMSCAKPVVGSDAAGNGLAIRDGVNGFLTPTGDDAALAEAIRVLVHDPALRERMGAAGRNLIDTELGWPQLARRYAAHFEQLGAAIPERAA